jgi:hypothetical protein
VDYYRTVNRQGRDKNRVASGPNQYSLVIDLLAWGDSYELEGMIGRVQWYVIAALGDEESPDLLGQLSREIDPGRHSHPRRLNERGRLL